MNWGSTVPPKQWGTVPEGPGARTSSGELEEATQKRGMTGQEARHFPEGQQILSLE